MNTLLLTKIIATLGPASGDKEMIKKLIEKGARAFRINFSHGSFDDHIELIRNIREAMKETGYHVAILGDLPGPKIRIGKVADGGIMLKTGDKVIFTEKETHTGASENDPVFSTNYPGLMDEVKPGEPVLLDDGSVRLIAEKITKRSGNRKLHCLVIEGGIITSNKGVNLPETDLKISALTQKDLDCIDFAVKHKLDFLALSFVRRASDLVELKKILMEKGVRPVDRSYRKRAENDTTLLEGDFEGFIPVIAKIEKPQALSDLDNILGETDMIMVARGDLGVEMDLAEVAIHQKEIIRKCRHYGVPVIVATQMLQSMIYEAIPTRAEVSDVANAIFDGADAVMLSGETAIGKHPLEVVDMMNRVIRKTNDYMLSREIEQSAPSFDRGIEKRSAAIAAGTKTIIKELSAGLIIVWSELGGSAVFLSEQRIPRPIIAFSHNRKTLCLLSLLYGVIPVFLEKTEDAAEFFIKATEIIREKEWEEPGRPLVFVHRDPFHEVGLTNEITIKYL